MPKIHYFPRYSSVENTVTNNTLQLIARIYNHSTIQASRLLSELAGEEIEIGISIRQQQRAKDSVPDGSIFQESFKILIESKVDAPVDIEQLVRHSANFKHESKKFLLLLTKQPLPIQKTEECKKAIPSGIIFKNVTYMELCTAIETLFKEYELEMRALVDDYRDYCNEIGLYDQSKFLMRIVPCGNSVDINIKYGIYFHPSERNYTNHSYIGIYSKKAVQAIWQIDSVFDVTLTEQGLQKKLVDGRETNEYDEKIIAIIEDAKIVCSYEIAQDCRFFCGQIIPTNYIKTSNGGIQGARFVNLKDEIGEFSSTREIAEKLSQKEWQ
jgi:hypothetical protein